MKKILILTLALILAASGLATASVLDFEDLYTGVETYYYPIASPYHGFAMGDYNGFMTQNWSYNYYGAYDGYYYGTTGHGSMFTAYGEKVSFDRGDDFNVSQLDLTAAHWASLDATIEGWKGGSLIYATNVTVTNTGPTVVNLGYSGIDTLSVSPSISHGAYQLVIDNVVYSSAPLPSTLLFLGTGLLGLVGCRGIQKS